MHSSPVLSDATRPPKTLLLVLQSEQGMLYHQKRKRNAPCYYYWVDLCSAAHRTPLPVLQGKHEMLRCLQTKRIMPIGAFLASMNSRHLSQPLAAAAK